MSTVVVGFIPTPAGEAALQQGIVEASRGGHELLVVNSAPVDRPTDDNVVQGGARERLDALLAATGLQHDVRQPSSGRYPAEEIAAAADECDAVLVVIGMRQRETVGKLIMSSVAQQVMLEVGCPVLTVKAGQPPPPPSAAP